MTHNDIPEMKLDKKYSASPAIPEAPEKAKKEMEKTYSIIDELADEFELGDVPFYPEVHWIGRKKTFESLGINKEYKEYFEKTRKDKNAIYLPQERIILTGTDKNKKLAEEAMHFLHYENSGVNSNLLERQIENPSDFWSLQIIIEGLGYFGSKVISKRKHTYKEFDGYKDFMSKINGREMDYDELLEIVKENQESRNFFYVYKNAFDLGEGLYNHYISGNIPKKQIRNLMKNSFKKDFSATKKYMYLREKLMRYSYLNGHAKSNGHEKLNGHTKTLKINSIML